MFTLEMKNSVCFQICEMDEDEEYVGFKVTSDDLEYELDPMRSFRKQTKDQAIYGRLHLPFTSRLATIIRRRPQLNNDSCFGALKRRWLFAT